MAYDKKKKLMEIVPGKDLDDISTKDFKTTNVQITKEKYGESQENNVGKNGNINKEIENLKRNQEEILDLKNTMNCNEKSTQQDNGRY